MSSSFEEVPGPDRPCTLYGEIEEKQENCVALFPSTGLLYVTQGEGCHKRVVRESDEDCTQMGELCTEQEEPDTLMLHTSHASSARRDCVTTRSSVTGIAVHTRTFSHDILARILFCTGTTQSVIVKSTRTVLAVTAYNW